MKLDEISDPNMKLKLEMSRMREEALEQRSIITELAKKVAGLEKIVTFLVKKLGPQ